MRGGGFLKDFKCRTYGFAKDGKRAATEMALRSGQEGEDLEDLAQCRPRPEGKCLEAGVGCDIGLD